MKIKIIGQTNSDLFDLESMGKGQWVFGMPGKAHESEFEKRADEELETGQILIEFAGRLCYESWDLPNENTATNEKYIQNIVNQGHESVLEHVSVTFYVEGVSRNLSHELIRHRHLSFSELSQRFVDMSDAKRVIPPVFRNGDNTLSPMGIPYDYDSMYENAMKVADELGLKRKQAREAARYYLPAGTETKFVVTGNLRAWRDVLKKRDSEHADAEMQLFAKEIKRQLLNEYPDVFRDLNEGS